MNDEFQVLVQDTTSVVVLQRDELQNIIVAAPAPGSVSSVAGRLGAVTLSQADIAGLTIGNSPTFAGATFSGLTASRAIFTDASKNLVSNAITGTGNVVMSASPTLTGTAIIAALTASGTITANGALTANPANANISLVPTGTGIVTINPATVGAMDNVVIGAGTPKAATVTDFTTTGNTSAPTPANYDNSTKIATTAFIWTALQQSINDIGLRGQQGFGVGICPTLPSGYSYLLGTTYKGSDNYGNYQYSDGSIMCWIPACYYKWGTGSNGVALNDVDIQPLSAFTSVAAANASGYALFRADYDNGVVQQGQFVDKYLCSNNGGIASSIKLGNPLSSSSLHNPFAGLNGAPANAYYGAIAGAQTRGSKFFCNSRFIFAKLAILAYAHAKAATASTYCAWYDGTGVMNFPKGCNNNALGDTNDTSLSFTADGYSNAAKTGSANIFARTTHNGQNCGIADLNGDMWEITTGIASDGTDYYILNTAAQMSALTGGDTLATDLWGATGLAANYTNLGATYEAATASNTLKLYGAATQVLSEATSGNEWAWAGAGAPLAGGVGGTNAFGNDGLWDYRPAELCVISGGSWVDGSSAGAWALDLSNVRGYSGDNVGFRAASYL
ncbi:MAG: hypothetical protein ACYDBH_00475 [Acidobacteriaceae bacterium]